VHPQLERPICVQVIARPWHVSMHLGGMLEATVHDQSSGREQGRGGAASRPSSVLARSPRAPSAPPSTPPSSRAPGPGWWGKTRWQLVASSGRSQSARRILGFYFLARL
jgi:hypothetical protein